MSELYFNDKNNSIEPTILLIVATYNCADTLVRCIEGFISQTYPNKKIVIIDGGSTDGTVDIIRSYQDEIAYWVSEPDRGIYHAWNKALACGVDCDWLQFMGGDDYYYDNGVLSNVAKTIEAIYPKYLLSYAKTKILYQSGAAEYLGRSWSVDDIKSTGNFPSVQVSFFYHKSIFNKYGLFDDSFKISGDLEHFFRFVEYEPVYFLYDVISTVHCIGGISTNPAYDLLHMDERERAFIIHGYMIDKNLSYYYIRFVRVIKHWLYNTFGDRVLRKIVSSIRYFTKGKKIGILTSVKKSNMHNISIVVLLAYANYGYVEIVKLIEDLMGYR